ncbi:MAG: DUF547 domain-containing protein [Alphaproteobacteria bacterium]|nr:DUF547 domain-containing protein [Alphaproteobacteria bacterium]
MRRGSRLLLAGLAACRPLLAPVVDPPATDPLDAYDALLAEVVHQDGGVDYAALATRREALDAFVAWVGAPREVDANIPRHAFLLNAYNALVLHAVLHDGVPASVYDLRGWIPLPGSAFFYERAFLLDGRPTSLWEIEHELLRFRLLDPRDHGALSCATRSCPPLRAEAYRDAGLRSQLDEQMMRWLEDPVRGLAFEGDVLLLSPLFDTYRRDFEFSHGGEDLCAVLARWTEPRTAARLRRLARNGCPHVALPYDRSLNDAPATARVRGSGRPGAGRPDDAGDTGADAGP